jgi:PHD/YefM family antitoxin component YafN of YafNO toxin-antitoxin module
MKVVTLTELRKNIFQLVDHTLETGEPLVIERKGRRAVLQAEAGSPEARQETEAEREARWERFWNEPPPPGWENYDLSSESLDQAVREGWRFDEPLEPDD